MMLLEQFAAKLQEATEAVRTLKAIRELLGCSSQVTAEDIIETIRKKVVETPLPTEVPLTPIETQEPAPSLSGRRYVRRTDSTRKPVMRPCQTCSLPWSTIAYATTNCDDCRAKGAVGRNTHKSARPRVRVEVVSQVPKGTATYLTKLPNCTTCNEPYTPNPKSAATVCIRCQQKELLAMNERNVIRREQREPERLVQINYLGEFRAQIAANNYEVEPPTRPTWPSLEILGFPCKTCVYGKLNLAAENNFECTGERARDCCPAGPAWLHTKKS